MMAAYCRDSLAAVTSDRSSSGPEAAQNAEVRRKLKEAKDAIRSDNIKIWIVTVIGIIMLMLTIVCLASHHAR